MPMRHLLLPLILLASLLLPAAAHADPLRAYVERPDDSFTWEIVDESELGPHRMILVRLTSQTWQGVTWWHWMRVILPDQPRDGAAALLWIQGGSNHPEPRNLSAAFEEALQKVVDEAQAPVVVLGQVPNQPLMGNLHEDALIALTFARYLMTGEATWPLLLPMTRSAVAAMDAAEAILDEETGTPPDGFLVAGASKRGWTTWLTAAIDPRVRGIAPMVIDIVNLPAQLEHQQRALGGFRGMLGDYTALNLPRFLDTPRGRDLAAIVDPYAYRDRLTMPKMIFLGTNDPYWATDASSLYFYDLPDPKWLYYQPNAGHSISLQVAPMLGRFMRSIDAAREGQASIGQLNWHVEGDRLVVASPGEGAQASHWTATAPTPDFLKSRWISQPLPGEGPWSVPLAGPPSGEGYAAHFVEVRVPTSGGGGGAGGGEGGETLMFPMSTTIHIRPVLEGVEAAPDRE